MADKVEVDLIIKALSQGFEKLSADIGKLGEEVEKPAEKTKKTTSSLTELKSALDLTKEAAQTFGQVFKTAFDFGLQGAVVTQTTESFALLLAHIGAAPDLLEQLRAVSGGTISDLRLMSATSTLLAGAQGELATNLANSTPRLLEIAAAANKLNPSLGDTAFLYESLATGIKRSSPMILDNLGLTIKIGAANETMANQLGKTVEQLTAAEKQQALLNATLEAGNVLLQQVGGSTETAMDAYSRLDASLQNLSNTLKASVSPFLADAADGLTTLLVSYDETTAALDEHNAALIESGMAYADYVAEQQRAIDSAGLIIGVLGTQAAQQRILTEEEYMAVVATRNLEVATTGLTYAQLAAQGAYEYAVPLMQTWGENTFYADQYLTSLNTTTWEAYASSAQFADRLKAVNAQSAKLIENAKNAKTPLDDLNAQLSQNISSPLSNFIDDLQFFISSGGQDFVKAFAKIKEALAEGKITASEAQVFSGELLASIEAVKVKAGEITFEQAAENLASTLNVSLEDAILLLENVKTAAEIITDTNYAVSVDTGEAETAYEMLLDMEKAIQNVSGTHNVTINVTTNGNIPNIPGKGGGQGGTSSGAFLKIDEPPPEPEKPNTPPVILGSTPGSLRGFENAQGYSNLSFQKKVEGLMGMYGLSSEEAIAMLNEAGYAGVYRGNKAGNLGGMGGGLPPSLPERRDWGSPQGEKPVTSGGERFNLPGVYNRAGDVIIVTLDGQEIAARLSVYSGEQYRMAQMAGANYLGE